MNDKDRETIFEAIINTESGRELLANSLSDVIRCGGMCWYGGVAYLHLGGYPYPETALKAVIETGNEIGIPLRAIWQEKYREINNKWGELKEPPEYWDWERNKNDPNFCSMLSLANVKRAIRDYLAAQELQCLLGCMGDCESCQTKKTTKDILIRASEISST